MAKDLPASENPGFVWPFEGTIIKKEFFYPREQVLKIYTTSSQARLLEHMEFLEKFIEQNEQRVLDESSERADIYIAIATYAAMCLKLAREELARRN